MSDRDHPTMAEGGRKKGESKAERRLTERVTLLQDVQCTTACNKNHLVCLMSQSWDNIYD